VGPPPLDGVWLTRKKHAAPPYTYVVMVDPGQIRPDIRDSNNKKQSYLTGRYMYMHVHLTQHLPAAVISTARISIIIFIFISSVFLSILYAA